MNSEILTVAGIVVSACFGIWGVYLALRKNKYPGEITFIEDRYVGLFDEIVGNLDELSILYKNTPIKHNLVLIKGYLLNSGSKDITPTMTGKELTANLPEKFKWIEAKIVSSSSQIDAVVKIASERSLAFELGFFRRNESISFEALAEVPETTEAKEKPNEQVRKGLIWKHRIADTAKLRTRTFPSDSRNRRKAIYRPVIVGTILASFLIPILVLTDIFPKQIEINYEIDTANNEKLEVSLNPNLDGSVKLEGINTEYEKIMKIEDFFQNFKWKPIISQKSEDEIAYYTSLIILPILGCILIFIEFGEYYKIRKLKKILNVSNIETATINNKTT